MLSVVNGESNEITQHEMEQIQGPTSLKEFIDQTPPMVWAISQITINNGEIAYVGVSNRLSGAYKMDVGMYAVFFTEPQQDNDYLALAYNGGEYRCFVRASEKFEDYLILNAVDLDGNPADPPSISLEIKRVN